MHRRLLILVVLIIAVSGALVAFVRRAAHGPVTTDAAKASPALALAVAPTSDGQRAATVDGVGESVMADPTTPAQDASPAEAPALAVTHEVAPTPVGSQAGAAPGADGEAVDPYAKDELISETTTAVDTQGEVQRTRVLRTAFKYPLLRVEERWSGVPGAAGSRRLAQTAMVADHVLVTLSAGIKPEALRAALAADAGGGANVAIRAIRPMSGLVLVSFSGLDAAAMAAARERLAATGLVAVSEPDFIVHAIRNPNDPSFASGQRDMQQIHAPEAWDTTTGSRSVLVGLIDSGVDYTHPDLAANIWTNPGETGLDVFGHDKATNGIDDDGDGFVDDVHGWNFVADNAYPLDDNDHGTHCAGTIGAVGNNAQGISGVCWQVSIVPLKFLDSAGQGAISDAVDAVAYAQRIGVSLTSNSWGGSGQSAALKAQIEAAGVLFVAAAGNSGLNNDVSPTYPASYTSPNIISVLATDFDPTYSDVRASFSNYGPTSVDLAAPGVNIYSTKPNGSYQTLSGTSMACPHVAGACALIASQAPGISADDLKALIMNTVDRNSALTGTCVSGGRLNVSRAITSTIDDAIVVTQQVPDRLYSGEAFHARFVLTNTGLTTWKRGLYSLGPQAPQDNLTWGTNRIALPYDVAKGQTVTIETDLRAPTAVGTYTFQWRMVHDGVRWFGAFTPAQSLTIADDAAVVVQQVPNGLLNGEVFHARFVVTNTGQTTWQRGLYSIGPQAPQDNLTWGTNRIALPYDVPRGQTVTIETDLTAPAAVGTYTYQWRMVHDGVTWFGAFTPARSITVGAASAQQVIGGGNFNVTDYDNDGKTDTAVFATDRKTFFVIPSSTVNPATPDRNGDVWSFSFQAVRTGPGTTEVTDLSQAPLVPLTGDWDGDGMTDYAVYDKSRGQTWIKPSRGGYAYSVRHQTYRGVADRGSANDFIPLAGTNYLGSDKNEFTLFDPYTATFYLDLFSGTSRQGGAAIQFGVSVRDQGDPIPLLGDFDNDGKTDLAIFDRRTATFYIQRSSGGPLIVLQFGQGRNAGGDPEPIVGDYDGDGLDDVAVFQRANSSFAVHPTNPNVAPFPVLFGQGTHYDSAGRTDSYGNPLLVSPSPLFGDYNGDGRTDIGVFQSDQALFVIWPSFASLRYLPPLGPAYFRPFGPAPTSLRVTGRPSRHPPRGNG